MPNVMKSLVFVLALLPATAFAEEEPAEETSEDTPADEAEPGAVPDAADEPEPSPADEPAPAVPAVKAPATSAPDEDGGGPPADDGSEAAPGTVAAYWKRPDAPKPRFSDFVNTRLTFYVGDDNLLAGNADRSPALGMANDYPELFFEGLNAEKGKVVTETHMVLYSKMPGFLRFVDTEAAFVAEFELARDPDDSQLVGRFRDDGSWLAATFWLGDKGNSPSIKLTAWPFSADRFRLGFLYDLTWGGDKLWTRNRSPVPGARITLDLQKFYLFVGAKSLVRLRADNNETENYWGVLGGLGPKIPVKESGLLAYDLNGGYFTRGTFQQDPHRSVPVVAFGASHRLSFGWNESMAASADLRLMMNDREEGVLNFQGTNSLAVVPSFKGAFGFGASVEFSTLWQSLINADDPGARVYDDAITAAFRGRVRFMKSMRVGVDLVYRDVSFLVLNVPGLVPYVSFAEETEQKAQVYGALWWDWFIEQVKLRPGVIFGLMQPAAFSSAPDAAGNRQTQVIREANDYEIMPTGSQPFSILSVKASLRWHLSPMLAIAGEVAFTQDFNNTRVVTDPDTGVGVRELDTKQARQLGLNLFMQAAF